MPAMSSDGPPAVHLSPNPGAWADLARRHAPPAANAVFRRELRLPTAGPLIMTGHQAELWHPGILAKYIAAAGLAAHLGSAWAHVVVDQDAGEALALEYPSRAREELRLARWAIQDPAQAEIPPGFLPPFDVPPPPLREHPPALPSVEEGLGLLAAALTQFRGAPTAAGQIALALATLRKPWIASEGTGVMATRIGETSLFRELLEKMRGHPEACIGAYNQAVSRFPGAGVRPLAAQKGELPLWVVAPGRPRRPAHHADLEGGVTLAPRGLFMTGLLRWAGCDLFIHGLGGNRYDRVTEAWLEAWLGAHLAPSVLATADCYLPLGSAEVPDPAHARWLAHHARHDPAALGDTEASRRKAELVGQIARAKGSRRAGDLFRELHGVLAAYRIKHAGELEGLGEEARRAGALAAAQTLARRRDWAFPLYPAPTLSELREAIELSFSRA